MMGQHTTTNSNHTKTRKINSNYPANYSTWAKGQSIQIEISKNRTCGWIKQGLKSNFIPTLCTLKGGMETLGGNEVNPGYRTKTITAEVSQGQSRHQNKQKNEENL